MTSGLSHSQAYRYDRHKKTGLAARNIESHTKLLNLTPAATAALAGIAQALGAKGQGGAAKLITAAQPNDQQQALADALKQGDKAAVLLGNLAQAHPDYAILRDLAAAIAEAAGKEHCRQPSTSRERFRRRANRPPQQYEQSS